MRIGLVIGQLTAGGAERQLVLLARALTATRYDPIVYCMSDRAQPFGEDLLAAGIPLRVLSGPPPKRVGKLVRALRADGIEMVHAWLYIGNTYAWLANVAAGGWPLITSARNCKIQGRLHALANRFAFQASRRIVVNSREVARYVHTRYGAPAGRLALIYNGIDAERFSPAPRQRRDHFLVAGIGRLVPQKDPQLFLKAAVQLAQLRPDTRFVFVGEGPLRSTLESAITAHGLADRFSLPGETRDVPGLLRQADLFWLTSAWEGLPNVVLEAMACGVPVIATDVGGSSELIRSGVDGFLVAYKDATAIVHYSRELLSDSEFRAAVAVRARERAMQFASDNMVAAMIGLYDQTLAAA